MLSSKVPLFAQKNFYWALRKLKNLNKAAISFPYFLGSTIKPLKLTYQDLVLLQPRRERHRRHRWPSPQHRRERHRRHRWPTPQLRREWHRRHRWAGVHSCGGRGCVWPLIGSIPLLKHEIAVDDGKTAANASSTPRLLLLLLRLQRRPRSSGEQSARTLFASVGSAEMRSTTFPRCIGFAESA